MHFIDKTDLRKLNPKKLFVVQHSQLPTLWIHIVNGKPEFKTGFEGCAIFNEENIDKLTNNDPKTMKVIPIDEMARLIPVFLNFPKGHPLHNANINVRTVDGPYQYTRLNQ